MNELTLSTALETALARIEDMLAGDDGQAFKEARKFLPVGRAALAAHPGSVGEPVLLPEAVGHAADALTHIIAAAQSAKVALDAGLPNGQPVHPASARLTWPLSTAMMAEEKLRKLLAAAPTEAKPAQDAVDAERLPPMPENVLADIQQAHEYVSMWAKGEAYYAPVSAYDDMPGKRKATIKDVMKSAKFIAPRLMSASLAMRDYFAAIDVYTNKKGGV